jgi:DNA repair exonuclease SbcCD ATPase subunit
MKNINTWEHRMTKIETQLESHCRSNDENFAEIKVDIKEVKTETNEIKKSIEGWIEKADSRYASKRTEQLFYSTLGAAIVYILYYIFKMVGIS